MKDWQEFAREGRREGPTDAKVTIIVFADFECPSCKAFAMNTLPSIRNAYANRVALVYRHWPLLYHKFAYPAARAAECAGDQGRFEAYHDALFLHSDSLGLKTFESFARDAGVPEIGRFNECNGKDGQVPSIERDIEAAARIGAEGTPTIVVNGKVFLGAPTVAMLSDAIEEALRAS